jgi:hypothetical protein
MAKPFGHVVPTHNLLPCSHVQRAAEFVGHHNTVHRSRRVFAPLRLCFVEPRSV